MAKRQALYIMAVPGPRQQDIWRQSSVVTNPAILKSGGSFIASGSNNHRQKRHRSWRILSTPGGSRWQGEAVTATARKIAVLFYNALRHGMTYKDPGAAHYEERYRTRVLGNLQRRAKAFGFVLRPAPEQGELAVF